MIEFMISFFHLGGIEYIHPPTLRGLSRSQAEMVTKQMTDPVPCPLFKQSPRRVTELKIIGVISLISNAIIYTFSSAVLINGPAERVISNRWLDMTLY